MNMFKSGNPNYITNQDKYEQFEDSFNKYDSLEGNITKLGGDLTNYQDSTDPSTFGVLGSLINSAWSVLQLMPTTLNFMGSAFSGLNTVLGIPKWVGTLISLIVVVIIVFAIWAAIFQREL